MRVMHKLLEALTGTVRQRGADQDSRSRDSNKMCRAAASRRMALASPTSRHCAWSGLPHGLNIFSSEEREAAASYAEAS